MSNTYDFAYSVGLVRALETLLLNENEVERMILAKDGKDAFKVLNEFDYANNKTGVENPSNFQVILDEGLLDIRDVLEKITPNKRVLNILLLQYDFHNIKTLIKAKLSDKTFGEIENLLSKMGAIKIDALKTFIFDETDTAFNLDEREETYLKKKIKKVQKLFEKHDRDPQVIDLYLDQKLMKMIYNIARDSENLFLKRYVEKLIDLNNLKLLFRMKAQGKDIDVFERGFLWHGSITFSKLKDAFEKDISEMHEALGNARYSKIAQIGYKYYEEEGSFLHLEKEIENYLTDFIKEAKLVPFGPEPLIAYFLAKRNHAMVIRMIMINKLNEIEPEEIKPRLRNLYS